MNLHFPGSTRGRGVLELAYTSPATQKSRRTGSYSRNLNHLWSTDAVVLIWKHAAVEHYYRGLAHGAVHKSKFRGASASTPSTRQFSCTRLNG